MDGSGEAVDDQGSGWFQVKKKHRSGAKFSIQGWSRGLLGKNGSNITSEKNGKVKNKTQIPKKGVNLSVHGQGSVVSSVSLDIEVGNDASCSNKSVIKQDTKDDESPKLSQLLVANSSPRAGDAKILLDVVPKIKWGDLEDDVLIRHHENTSQGVAKCSGTGEPADDTSHYETISVTNKEDMIEATCKEGSGSSSNHTEVPNSNGKISVPNDVGDCKNVDNESFKTTDNHLSSTCRSGEAEVVLKIQMPVVLSEVNDSDIPNVPNKIRNSAMILQESESELTENGEPEISTEADIVVKLQMPVISAENESKPSELQITNGNCGSVVIPLDSESVCLENTDSEISSDAGTVVKIQLPVISEVNEPQISEVSVRNRKSSPALVARDRKSLAREKYGSEILGQSTKIALVEGCSNPPDTAVNNELLKAHTVSPFEDGGTNESKERFRERLWCFLFENLNRAVDELYLLCELECDVDQMKEAILVLEEAASDFKDLTTRVQEFENVKRSSSQSIDGIRTPLKSDHRRPHALSWEVRRMTTSPHRAEILSSSLEAFKKIQQERSDMLAANDEKAFLAEPLSRHHVPGNNVRKLAGKSDGKDPIVKSKKQNGYSDPSQGSLSGDKRSVESGRSNKVNSSVNNRDHPYNSSSSDINVSLLSSRDISALSGAGKSKRESEAEKLLHKKERISVESAVEKNLKFMDPLQKQIPIAEKDKEKRCSTSWKSMYAWKEKRNWEDILSSPFRVSSRASHSPGLSRRSAERTRILHDKLMSPEKKKKTALDLKKEAEEKHARATRIRNELENERVQKLQRTSEKLNRVNEWQAVRTTRLREGMYARQQRSESRHEAFLAQVVRRAGDESSKVNEVRFITSLNGENKKLMLRQKLQDSELRRAEKLQVIKIKQREDMAREEAVLERRKLIEAEKLQRLAETQRKKEEAQVRREEERKASSAAREARAIEQLRRREERAKAQQEEAELLAQKLAERLSESEQRRKFYLEQIRERASMDFRDQSSPLIRRSIIKDFQGRSTPTNNGEGYQENSVAGTGGSTLAPGNGTLQHSLKRRIKKIRQRLMALKYEYSEPLASSENGGIGYRTAVATARAKLGRWLQELQRLRQARKEGAASIGLIAADIIKFLEGKDLELQASRQAGLLDFIASALPASHTSKPEACQVTIHLLKLLRVVLSLPTNRSYFLAQNLLPPIIPMLSASLENYIKMAASLNVPGTSNLPSSKTSAENFEPISDVLDNFLWIVGTVMGHRSSDERELQMLDGLLELLTAYQVIHRLRDLFALYDRPQVEGSPFPSSILLSIHLLVVLTYRPKTTNCIDWDLSPAGTAFEFENKMSKPADTAPVVLDSANLTSEDSRPPLSVLNGSEPVTPPDVLEDRQNESCNLNRSDELLFNCKDGERNPTCCSEELNDSNVRLRDVPDRTREILVEEKDDKHMVNVIVDQKSDNMLSPKQPVAFLLSAISETGLVSLPSLLTSVLLQANNRLSIEQGSYILPSNFEEVATGVLKVLNNLALLDIIFMQRMLARPDLKMEFFHLMSFLLSHCTSKWKVASDQVGLLLLESLLLLGYFALFHRENQAVLRWGKSPTILHKVCDLPFVFFSDPELMPILSGTLVAACYGCEQNKSVVLQELSMDMLLSLLTSCRNVPLENSLFEDSGENNQQNSEHRKIHGEAALRSGRYTAKSTRVASGKGCALVNGIRGGKTKSQRDCKTTKYNEDSLKHNPVAPEASVMLHCRFPSSFIDRAERFFSAGINGGEV
ncbi:uncharacterized protein LOC126675540 isoform X2 [Mercurialis annua]|uniref:uncharacterized protein LOC126675540 isoform X2 n=1 Tax=Mercurialis annua TaxID=3986 RepID=UPI00215F81F8|nr:uncharacterized protein LOC126675540 isoform X2 [Mercurialis annua]